MVNSKRLIPLIGIPGFKQSDGSFGVGTAYMNWLRKFGDVIILPPTDIVIDIDLLVLPGGPDLSTTALKVPPSYYNQRPCPFREHYYVKMLDKYTKLRIPVLGICLGAQALAAKLGAGLVLHQPVKSSNEHRGELVDHLIPRVISKALENRQKRVEDLSLMEINSLHHQLIPATEDNHLGSCYYSANDDNIEMFQTTLNGAKIIGVQFHPEELADATFVEDKIKNILDPNYSSLLGIFKEGSFENEDYIDEDADDYAENTPNFKGISYHYLRNKFSNELETKVLAKSLVTLTYWNDLNSIYCSDCDSIVFEKKGLMSHSGYFNFKGNSETSPETRSSNTYFLERLANY